MVEIFEGKADTYYQNVVIPFLEKTIKQLSELRKATYSLRVATVLGEDGVEKGFIGKFGNDGRHGNCRVSIIKELNEQEQKDYGATTRLVGKFTLSAFPNCCGMGLISRGYHTYTNDEVEDSIMANYLAVMLAKEIGFPTVLAVDNKLKLTYQYSNAHIYIKSGFKNLGDTIRRGYSRKTEEDLSDASYRLNLFLRQIDNISMDKLMEEFKGHIGIKEEIKEVKNEQSETGGSNFLLYAREL